MRRSSALRCMTCFGVMGRCADMPVEYRVRPVTRYIVTRYEDGVGSTQIGEYPSAETAHSVGHAMCDVERIKAGEPLDSPAFVYPGVVSGG